MGTAYHACHRKALDPLDIMNPGKIVRL